MADDESKAFEEKLKDTLVSGFSAIGLVLGWELGLFRVLAEYDSPRSAGEIASAAGMKERYVEEWLLQMSCAKIVDMNPEGTSFFLPVAHRHALTNISFPNTLMKYHLRSWGRLFNDMAECFKTDGPRGLPYTKHEGYDEFLEILNQKKPTMNPNFADDVINVVPGLATRLSNGISFFEVGCGLAGMVLQLAQRYPNSQFTGNEIQDSYVTGNISKARERGLSNVTFELGDVCSRLPENWAGKFDCVFVNTVIHDLSRPDLGLKEIHRILKPDGVFVMVDRFARDDITPLDDKLSAFFYGVSMIQCVAPSMYYEGGWGLGCMWKTEKGREIVREAGFKIIQEVEAPIPETGKLIFICSK